MLKLHYSAIDINTGCLKTCWTLENRPKQELARYSGDHGADWQEAGVLIRLHNLSWQERCFLPFCYFISLS